MKRLIEPKLLAWKSKKGRNPLIIKGARQVGKTYQLHAFGKAYYPHYHYFNFEKDRKLASIFAESLEPEKILQALEFHQQRKINRTEDLIIFDEIQACPDALTSLKYFSEEAGQTDICAAGSLLGVYLAPVSYPVGKVDHLSMYPMSFIEFLAALGDDLYVELLQKLTIDSDIPQVAHEHLWERLKHYFITGGLPEIVNIYCERSNEPFTAFQYVRERQAALIEDYFADIAKHAGKINAMHINRIWRNIPEQLAQTQDGSAKKFKFKGVIPSIDRYNKLADALDWLESAGLILKVNIVNKGVLPFKAYVKHNAFKLFLFDIGVLGALSEITPKQILDYDYGSYKGFFAENYIAQAFTFSSSSGLYSWAENKSEIEFVREVDAGVIPIEIKSGWITQAKSLNIFSQKYQPAYRVIMSAKKMCIDQKTQVQCLPLYLAELFPLPQSL